jgi:hypothetical protein
VQIKANDLPVMRLLFRRNCQPIGRPIDDTASTKQLGEPSFVKKFGFFGIGEIRALNQPSNRNQIVKQR